MGTRSGALLAGACSLLVGCGDECENAFKIKTEYRTIFWEDSWNENSKDTIVDGALRTSTWTYKSGRSLSIRCFQTSDRDRSIFDIRYSINAPLLKQLAPELQTAGEVKLLVNVDGSNVASLEARVIPQDDGIDFLASVPPALIDQLSSAHKDIVVMPRQKEKNLDTVLEFGVAKLRENLEPVKKACASLRNNPRKDPSRPDEPKKAENSPHRDHRQPSTSRITAGTIVPRTS